LILFSNGYKYLNKIKTFKIFIEKLVMNFLKALILHQFFTTNTLWSDEILADMPSCLGGEDHGINLV
jgi:hypothetical protein